MEPDFHRDGEGGGEERVGANEPRSWGDELTISELVFASLVST